MSFEIGAPSNLKPKHRGKILAYFGHGVGPRRLGRQYDTAECQLASRVVVHHGDPDLNPLPSRFAQEKVQICHIDTASRGLKGHRGELAVRVGVDQKCVARGLL